MPEQPHTVKSTSPPLPASPAPVTHYENFPVASWLCPPRLRPPIAALYHFARTADDLADEGDATPPERLAALAAYRADRKSTRLNSSHTVISYAVFCLKKKNQHPQDPCCPRKERERHTDDG